HPFIKTRFQSLLAEFGFAAKDNRLTTLGATSGDDHIRLLKLGLNYDRVDRRGRTFLSLYGFQGLGEAFGGMANNDPQATTQGADDRFTKATIQAGRIESLGGENLLILRGTGQVSTGPLVVIEQFLLGGPDSVRGYQLGERFFDEGFAVTAEARTPFFPSMVPSTQVGAFIDYGAGLLRNPAPGQSKSSSLTGTGISLNAALPYYESTFRVDLGFPLGPTPIGGTLSGGRSPTVYLQAIARF
ncbi:MAG: ShlB/FhaC/HecB family hemolysin secretion/activation protein, partial [Anaerolineales bacterium]